MPTKLGVRAAVLALLSLSFVLPFGVGAGFARAAGSHDIVISEINWAGSAGNPSDEWMELYNTTAAPIDLSAYRILANGAQIAAFPALTLVQPHHTFLISHLDAATSPTLGGAGGTPDFVSAALSLPDKDVQYVLETVADHQAVDMADDSSGAPLAGSDGTTGDMTIASMTRVFPVTDGTLAAAWRTPRTIGSGFKPGTVQYGTPTDFVIPVDPTDPNLELAAPSALAVSPASPAVLPVTPVVSGTAPSGAQEVVVRFDKLGTSQSTQVTAIVAADGTFSATVGGITTAGLYRISLHDADVIGNQSATVVLPIANSPQGAYVVNSDANVTVDPPVLNAYPSLVNTPKVTLTGTSAAGTVVVSVNGKDYQSQQLAAGQTAFSLDVNLVPNTVNSIEVRAQDSLGHTSAPTVATVTHDSIAPAALVTKLVVVSANPKGIVDSVIGLPGTTEPGATVLAYADSALTQLVGSVTARADGSFPGISFGDDKYATLYMLARDAAGNMDPQTAQAFANPVTFGGPVVPVSFTFSNIGQNQATLNLTPVSGAINYRLKYKIDGGTYSTPINLCSSGIACVFQRNLVNLEANSTYTVAITAVDQFGNESGYTEGSFKTLAVPVVAVTTASVTTPAATPAPTPAPTASPSTTYVPSPVGVGTTIAEPTPTPSPSPSASPEAGDVKSADTTASRNYTPWIILGVLLLLAILATLAYFYWFGGEDEEVAAATPADRAETPATKDAPKTDASASAPSDKASKPNDREKRW